MTYKTLKNCAIGWVVSVMLIWLLCAILSSCTVSNKHKSSEYKKIDSTTVNNSLATSEKKSDSATGNIKDSSTENDFSFYFANEVQTDPKEQANDLCGQDSIPQKVNNASHSALPNKIFTYKFNGNVIETPRPLDSAKVKIAGNTKLLYFTNVNKSENHSLAQHDSTAKKAEEDTINKDKKTAGASFLIWAFAIGIIFLFIYFGGGSRLIALFRKKKEDSSTYGNFEVPKDNNST